MNDISQGDLCELQDGIERFAQGHVQCVTRKSQCLIGSILTVGVDAFCMENLLDLLKKCDIHAVK